MLDWERLLLSPFFLGSLSMVLERWAKSGLQVGVNDERGKKN